MKKLLASSVIAATAFAGVAAPAMADLSANIGYASEYYYRGIMQAESSASAGVDFETGGFYAGVWTVDVGDGLEVDGYLGYGMEFGDFGVGIGYTTYQYTGDFDTEYNEVNLNLSYSFASLEVSKGKHDVDTNFVPEILNDDEDYTFVALTLEHNGFYGTYGTFSQDWDGYYVETGYGAEIGGFDTGVVLIFSQGDLGPKGEGWVNGGADDEAIVFSLSKSFDL
ncbi:MAG TPA: hypothetical protein ENI05_14840 [Porticoccus sp.]|nr:hypothetical protein [Porticoccus sp.]